MAQFDPNLVALGLMQAAVASRGFAGSSPETIAKFAYNCAEAFAAEGEARGFLVRQEEAPPTEGAAVGLVLTQEQLDAMVKAAQDGDGGPETGDAPKATH